MTSKTPRKYWKPVLVPLAHLSVTTGEPAAASEKATSNSPLPITITEAHVQCTTMAVVAEKE